MSVQRKWMKMNREEAFGVAKVCPFLVTANQSCMRECATKGENHVCCIYCHEYGSCEHGVFCPSLEKAVFEEVDSLE